MSDSTLVLNDIGLGNIDISSFVYEMPIFKVNKALFLNAPNLTNILIPDVEEIDDCLLENLENLICVILPGITIYHDNLFGSIENRKKFKLECAKISEGTKDIGTIFLNISSIQYILFPDTLSILLSNFLSGNENLIDLSIGRNVIIKNGAFNGIKNLQKLTIPALEKNTIELDKLTNLNSIEILSPGEEKYGLVNYLFRSCNASEITIEDNGNLLSNVNLSFNGAKKINSLDISLSQVTSFNLYSFNDCEKLKYIYVNDLYFRKIENNVFSNGESIVFSGSKNILSISFPGCSILYIDKFTSNLPIYINDSGFYKSIINQDIYFLPTNLGNRAFYNSEILNATLDLANLIKKSISEECFRESSISTLTLKNCNYILTKAFLNSSIEKILLNCENIIAELSSFFGCKELRYIDLNKFSIISSYSFVNCYNLANLDINCLSSILKIGDYAFLNSINITELSIPPRVFDVVDTIGYKAFNECSIDKIISKLTTVYDFNISLSSSIGRTLIPKANDKQDTIDIYNDIKDYFGIRCDFELLLKDCIFNSEGKGRDYACLITEQKSDGLHLVAFDSTSYDANLFILDPVIPSNILYIDYDVFKNVNILTAIDLNNVKKIGNNAFKNCINLKSIINLDYIEEIGNEVFLGCTNLSSIEFKVLTTAGYGIFLNCSNLSKIEFGNSPIASLPRYFINNCTKLNELTIYSNLLELLNYSLYNNHLINFIFDNRMASSIDNTTLLLNNECLSYVGSKFYTNDNDYKYPMFITLTSSNIYKVKNKAFNIELYSEQLRLIKVDNDYLNSFGKIEIDSSLLDDLTILSGAFNGVTRIKSMSILHSRTVIENGAFSGMTNLAAIYIDMEFDVYDFYELRKKYSKWLDPDSDTKIYFTNGILYSPKNGTYDWNFQLESSMFIPDPEDPTILIGINDSNIETGVKEAVIPLNFRIIASNSMATTNILSSIIINNDLVIIEDFAFANSFTIRNVEIDLAYCIKLDAFTKSYIEKIKISNTAKFYYNGNYYDNTENKTYDFGLNKSYLLRNIVYNDGIECIAASAIVNSLPMISSIVLPTSIKSIGDYAFAEMDSFFPRLLYVNLSGLSNLTSIGNYSFFNSIQRLPNNKLILPSSLTGVGAASFGYHEDAWTQEISCLDALEYIPSELNGKNIEYIGPSAFIYNHLRLVEFSESRLLSIGDYAFAYPKYKYDIQIPKSILHIGIGAFKNNVILNLEKIEKNIISIALDTIEEILSVINSLSSNDYSADNTISVVDYTCLMANGENYKSGNNFLFAYNNRLNFCPAGYNIDILNKSLISANQDITSIYIPGYIKDVNDSAFKDCSNAISCEIVNDEITLGPSVFYNCLNLEKINYANIDSLLYVEPYTFYNCKKLSNVGILSNCQYIGECAFYNNDAKTTFLEINLDELQNYSLKSIGPSAFAECDQLSFFFIPEDILSVYDTSFMNCNNMLMINIYMNASEFRDRFYDQLCSINDAVFDMFGKVRNDYSCIILFNDSSYKNNGIVTIDDKFIRCKVENGISSISAVDYFALTNEQLTYLNLSAIANIDRFTFRGISDLRQINILPSENVYLSSIGDFAFSKCESLINVNGNKLSCSYIGSYAFANCLLLNNMQIDLELIKSIGKGAFYNTSMLTLTFITDYEKESDDSQYIPIIKDAIGYLEDTSSANGDKNPLQIPDDCEIVVKNKSSGNIIGKFNYLFYSLLHNDIDRNRNSIVFVDKLRDSIKPILIVKTRNGSLPAILKNEFHASIIGRWK